AAGGDVQRYPAFTDYDVNGKPSSILLHSRLNIAADGTVPTDPEDGLNNIEGRPGQFYRHPVTLTPPLPEAPAPVFTRITRFPAPISSILPSSQPIPSNSSKRFVFNMAISLLGTGNFDQLTE